MAAPGIDFFEQRKHAFINTLHTWLLVGGSLALLAVTASVFFGADGVLYAAIFGGISLFLATRVSPQIVLRMYKAQEVNRSQFPAGHAMLDKLVERSGLDRRPGLYIVPSNMLNAFAVGRRSNSAIAMTDRLVRSMSQRELAGIMAHEVTHIVNQDIRVMAIADMVSRFTSMMSTFGMFALFANLPSILMGTGIAVPWLAVLLLMSAPTIGGLMQLALSRTREYDADLGAAMLTGDPEGLASALVKLEKAQGQHWEGMVLPGGRIPNPSLLRTHPRTEDRIERLMALRQTPEIVEKVARRELPPEEIVPEELRAGLPQRRSPVPRIRRQWGRLEGSKYAQLAGVYQNSGTVPLTSGAEGERPACDGPICPASGKPRIRISRGGVWW